MNHLEIRRNASLAGAVALVASVPAVAYLVRAGQTGAWLDWALSAVLVAMVLGYARSALDARTPLLVADEHGIRMRLGRSWQGLTWEGLEEVEHLPRRRWFRDGRLALFPAEGHDPELDRRTERQARLSSRLYGAGYAVPLGLTTRVSIDPELGDSLADALAELADGRAGVVELVQPRPGRTDAEADAETVDEARADTAEVTESTEATEATEVTDSPEPTVETGRRRFPFLSGRVTRRTEAEAGSAATDGTEPEPVRGPADETDDEPADEPRDDAQPVAASPTPSLARRIKDKVRVDVPITPVTPDAVTPVTVTPVAVTPEETLVRENGAPAWSSATVLIGDFAERPTVDPVIGRQLQSARERLGLTVDDLADRTRIRPHVIEAMEVDDFESCGGDFYARGHLRTLGRVLGVDAGPLVAVYDEKYADAPVDPRKVFEAELAQGARSSLRGTGRGGPRWSVAVAAVMTLVLAWSVARLVLDNSQPVASPAPGFANASGSWEAATELAPPVPVVVTASGGGAHVVIRDGGNQVVFKGDLAYGATQQFRMSPPIRVQSSDGSVTVEVDGRDCGRIGETGRSAQDVVTTEC